MTPQLLVNQPDGPKKADALIPEIAPAIGKVVPKDRYLLMESFLPKESCKEPSLPTAVRQGSEISAQSEVSLDSKAQQHFL